MEILIVGVIVALSAAVLVVQLRRKLGTGVCNCNAEGDGDKCANCLGKCRPDLTQKCDFKDGPASHGDAR